MKQEENQFDDGSQNNDDDAGEFYDAMEAF